jgi:PAS domain S-box-containing protein
MKLDPVLRRQTRRSFELPSDDALDGWLEALVDGDRATRARQVQCLRELLRLVDDTYAQHARDAALRTRSLMLSSNELTAANERLRAETRAQKRVIDALRTTANELLLRSGEAPIGPIGPIGDLALDAERLTALMLRLVREREAAIEASRASHERLALALDSVQDTLWDWDIARGEVYFSPRLSEVLGYPEGTTIDLEAWRTLLHPQDRAGVAALRRAHLAGLAAHYDAEFRVRMLDGGWRWLCSRGKVVSRDDSGEALRMIGTLSDITERKRAEDELREAKATAESASRAKGEFLASMSHEIRTPMNGILGLIDLTLQSELTDTQRRYLGLVKSSAGSLLTIINDILDASRIEAGRLALEELPFALAPLLRDALGPLEPRAQEKGLALSLSIDDALPPEGLGDPLRLRQIIVNLVGNAIKFTRRGSVTLRAGVRREGGERWLHLSVADTGVGIAPDKLERIFESFTQADASTCREFGGSGLGLTISRRLADLMGGRLWAESTPRTGSVFHVALPWRRARGAAAPRRSARVLDIADRMPARAAGDLAERDLAIEALDAPPDPPSGPGVLEVLLVEDHAVNRFLATALVRRMGHRVSCAATGAQALSMLSRHSFDLLLLDLQLPGMSGLEVAQRIRARERTHGGHCPIVALSAHAMPADRERSLAAGMDDHLTKPIDRERLHAVLQLLRRARLRHTA